MSDHNERVRTIWVQHEREPSGENVLVVGDDGGEFARTYCNDLAAAWRSAERYVEDLLIGSTSADPFSQLAAEKESNRAAATPVGQGEAPHHPRSEPATPSMERNR